MKSPFRKVHQTFLLGKIFAIWKSRKKRSSCKFNKIMKNKLSLIVIPNSRQLKTCNEREIIQERLLFLNHHVSNFSWKTQLYFYFHTLWEFEYFLFIFLLKQWKIFNLLTFLFFFKFCVLIIWFWCDLWNSFMGVDEGNSWELLWNLSLNFVMKERFRKAQSSETNYEIAKLSIIALKYVQDIETFTVSSLHSNSTLTFL